MDGEESILVSMYKHTNGRTRNSKQSFEMGNAWMQPSIQRDRVNDITTTPHSTFANASINGEKSFKMANTGVIVSEQSSNPTYARSFSIPAAHTDRHNIVQPRLSVHNPSHFNEWTRLYLFGHEHNTGAPRIQKTS